MLHFAIRRSLPEWILPHFGEGLPEKELDALAAALNEPANVCLRVNRLKVTRGDFQAQAKAAGIVLQAAKLAPDCLTAPGRVRLGDLPGAHDGLFEFQDEGSQVVTHLLGAQPGWTVVDACAGGGGKALHMAANMKNKGRVLAGDASPGRLASLPPRAKRAGATCISTFAKREEVRAGSADLVVLDVPCTGAGTWRRSPDLKWRTMRDGLREKVKLQKELLEEWRDAVKPGGLLAYITCSVLADENSGQIRSFLKVHREFVAEPPALAAELGIKPTREGAVTLLPHREGTDGFYLAMMRRKG
jgi:16S rRNA (cytosine967-C5)-methyltransferase